jgi:hypothetical protein
LTSQSRSAVSAQELRKFGLIFGGLVIGLFGLLIPYLADSLFQKLWPWYLGGAVVGLALIWPPILKPLYLAWMKFGDVAGWINTRIILLILFYLVVFPVGLLMKVFGSDPMRRKIEPEARSYRVDSLATAKNNMEKPY